MNLASLLRAATDGPADPGSLDLLNSLRDIHSPPPPGPWPPAPGWWLLAATLLAVGVTLLLWLRRRRRRRLPIRAALAELGAWRGRAAADDDPAGHAETLSALLRRAALVRYPRHRVAPLSGDDWLRFLDRTSGTDAFTSGPGRVLGNDRYAPDMELDVEVVAAIAERWLRQHLDGPAAGHSDPAPGAPPRQEPA
jgi:hypothetical protein